MCHWSPPWPPVALAAGNVRADGDRDAARPADTADGKTTEWKSRTLRAYQRRTLAADALIASTYLAGTNTRRVRRALAALFGGAVGKDTVSRVWRKVKSDSSAWRRDGKRVIAKCAFMSSYAARHPEYGALLDG